MVVAAERIHHRPPRGGLIRCRPPGGGGDPSPATVGGGGSVAGHRGEAESVAGDCADDDDGDGVFDFFFVSICYFSLRAA